MLSAQRVRTKARVAVRRREDQIEDDELESGEINLIPYLDIVTNLMLFLLASISANILFGQINTQLPDAGAPPPTTAADQNPNPDDKPLQLAVAVTKKELLLFSISGQEGTINAPKLRLPEVGRAGDQCDSNHMCQTNFCNAERKCEDRPGMPATPVFDYRAFNSALYDIAVAHFVVGGPRPRKAESYQVLLMADPSVPYGTLVSVIGALRCKMADFGQPEQTCFLPTADEALKSNPDPIDKQHRLYDTARTNYDPNIMALFPDVVFSGGFR
ncbi:MAG TPA: biopolymer transporter ExbD [Kofleriaceae bacterium]|nr:biopolymer transporter ExbD [Kofleriaceae bacterium]